MPSPRISRVPSCSTSSKLIGVAFGLAVASRDEHTTARDVLAVLLDELLAGREREPDPQGDLFGSFDDSDVIGE